MIPNYSGIVCANFGCRTNGSDLCFGAWHAKCFHQGREDKFPVLSLSDLEESLKKKDSLKKVTKTDSSV